MIGSKMFEIWRWEAGIYKEQLEKMIANGNAYRCFLSPEAGCKCVVLSISRFYRSYRWDHFNFWNGNIWRQFLHGGWVLDDLRSWMRWGPRLKGMIRRPNLSHAVIIFIFTPQNVTPWQHEQRTLRPSWCKVLGPMHQRKRCRQGLWHCSEVDRFDRVLKVLNQCFQMFSDVFSLILALCCAPAKNQFMLRTRKWCCRPWLTRASPTSTDSGYPLIGRSKELTSFHSIVAWWWPLAVPGRLWLMTWFWGRLIGRPLASPPTVLLCWQLLLRRKTGCQTSFQCIYWRAIVCIYTRSPIKTVLELQNPTTHQFE